MSQVILVVDVERSCDASQVIGELRDLFGAERGFNHLVDAPEGLFDLLKRYAAVVADAQPPGARVRFVARLPAAIHHEARYDGDRRCPCRAARTGAATT